QNDSLLELPLIRNIAESCQCTPAQVLLRWGVQRGTSVIPKTNSLERMKENLQIDHIQLTEAQMQQISSLNQNRRFNDPGHFCEAAFGTFFPIYE
ncbi:MAG: aldo/keto reductase, partial [Planctomyces sp.]